MQVLYTHKQCADLRKQEIKYVYEAIPGMQFLTCGARSRLNPVFTVFRCEDLTACDAPRMCRGSVPGCTVLAEHAPALCPQYNAVSAWVPASFETPSLFPAWLKFGKKKGPKDAAKGDAKPLFRQVRTNVGVQAHGVPVNPGSTPCALVCRTDPRWSITVYPLGWLTPIRCLRWPDQ